MIAMGVTCRGICDQFRVKIATSSQNMLLDIRDAPFVLHILLHLKADVPVVK